MSPWVISDVDGCVLPNPPQPPPPPALADLAAGVRAVGRFSLCSGRSAPYVLAVRDVLGAGAPVLAEYGGLLAHSVNRVEPLPSLREVAGWRRLIRRRLLEAGVMEQAVEEVGKSVVVTLVPLPGGTFPALRVSVARALRGLPHQVADSQSAVDVLPPGLDKGVGLRWWAEVCGADLRPACAIGDSVTDLDMLRLVGRPACPANAAAEVRAFVAATPGGLVAQEEATAGVAALLRRCCT